MDESKPPPEPADLFDPDQLDTELNDLLGSELAAVLAAASSGDRSRLHRAERIWALSVAAALDIDIEVLGRDKVDPTGQYLVAPLHEGFADVLALLQLPLVLGWVIRDELLTLPYFGEYLAAAGHIAIEPEAPRAAMRQVLSAAPPLLDGGESLVVFPQGSLLGIETRFQPGAFQLADRFGLPLLPVVLTGSHRVWDYPFDRTLHRGQTIRLEVLDAIDPGEAVAEMRHIESDMKRRARRIVHAPARHYVPERDGTWDGYRFDLD